MSNNDSMKIRSAVHLSPSNIIIGMGSYSEGLLEMITLHT